MATSTTRVPLRQPPDWKTAGRRRVYHGTTSDCIASIKARIDWTTGSPDTDFGIGFYVTTRKLQAENWAWERAQNKRLSGTAVDPVVLTFDFDFEKAAGLESLSFVNGADDAEDYWSFVFHCRSGANGHGRAGKSEVFDVVYGPVAAFWRQREPMQAGDQISFHTDEANNVLILKDVEVVVP